MSGFLNERAVQSQKVLNSALKLLHSAAKLTSPSLCVSVQWFVQASCAVSGTGLAEGLDWLSDQILRQKTHF